MRLPLLSLLLLVHTVLGGIADFATFCSRNYYGVPGTLNGQETVCEKEIRISDSWRNAKRYCESQQFTGRVKSHASDSFVCRFEKKFTCPDGFVMIQSQCYRFQKIDFDSREKYCKSLGAVPAIHATNTLLALLTVTGRQFYDSLTSMWIRGYGQKLDLKGDSDLAFLTVTRELGNITRLRASFRPEKKTESGHAVVCRTEASYLFKALEEWCAVQVNQFRMQAMFKDNMCVYYTNNLYTVPQQPLDNEAKIKQANIDLHKRCRLFSARDYIPADPEFVQTILPIHAEGHPVRVAGMPSAISRYQEATVWSMYSSKGEKSNIVYDEWAVSTGPRRGTLSAAGGAYTLGIMKMAGQGKMKYVDVSPHTPLPILCIATLKVETTRIAKCKCPGNSICDASNECVCPPKTEDMHFKYSYLNGDPAPRGHLCVSCFKTSIIVLIPNESCTPKAHIVRALKKIYADQDIARNKNRKIALVLYHLNAVEVLSFDNSNDENAFDRATDYFVEIFHKNVINNDEAFAYNDGHGGHPPVSHAHMPHTAWEKALKMLDNLNDHDPNHAKIVLYFTHHQNNPEYARWTCGYWKCIMTMYSHSFYFRIYSRMEQALNAIRKRHPRVKMIGVSAPAQLQDPARHVWLDWIGMFFWMTTGTSFNDFHFDTKLHYNMKEYGGPDNIDGESTMDTDEVAQAVDRHMCNEITGYPEMHLFKHKKT